MRIKGNTIICLGPWPFYFWVLSRIVPTKIGHLKKSKFDSNKLFFWPWQACHYGLLTHPRIVADQRQHYNMARSMAVLSLSFIILVTPWTMKEVAVSCIGSKVRYSSLACSLSFFLQGISFWNASNKSLKGQSISEANLWCLQFFKKTNKNH